MAHLLSLPFSMFASPVPSIDARFGIFSFLKEQVILGKKKSFSREKFLALPLLSITSLSIPFSFPLAATVSQLAPKQSSLLSAPCVSL